MIVMSENILLKPIIIVARDADKTSELYSDNPPRLRPCRLPAAGGGYYTAVDGVGLPLDQHPGSSDPAPADGPADGAAPGSG